jgi:hypothetical protein
VEETAVSIIVKAAAVQISPVMDSRGHYSRSELLSPLSDRTSAAHGPMFICAEQSITKIAD